MAVGSRVQEDLVAAPDVPGGPDLIRAGLAGRAGQPTTGRVA